MFALHGNWVDLVILVFLAFYVYEGVRRGFLALLGEMASFIISFLLALHFYPLAAKLLISNFSLSLGFANALGFIFTAIFSEIIIAFIITLLYLRLPKNLFTSRFNKVLGFLPALVDGVILIAFVLTVGVSLPLSGSIKQAIVNSKIGGVLVKQTHSLEKSLSAIFGGAVEETLSFLTVKPGSGEKVNLHFTVSEVSIDEASEKEMLNLVNRERGQRGLKLLTFDAKLQAVARAHSKDMFAKGYFSHINPNGDDPFTRIKNAGITFASAGENLAYASNAGIAQEGLMNSPGHRANILHTEFGKIGIGVIDGGIYGKMFTQIFTD